MTAPTIKLKIGIRAKSALRASTLYISAALSGIVPPRISRRGRGGSIHIDTGLRGATSPTVRSSTATLRPSLAPTGCGGDPPDGWTPIIETSRIDILEIIVVTKIRSPPVVVVAGESPHFAAVSELDGIVRSAAVGICGTVTGLVVRVRIAIAIVVVVGG